MAALSKVYDFQGKLLSYTWANNEWIAAIVVRSAIAEIWITAAEAAQDQMRFAFSISAAEASNINEVFITAQTGARRAMEELADEYQLDLDEYTEELDTLDESDEREDFEDLGENEIASPGRNATAFNLNLGPIGVEMAIEKHSAA